MLFAFENTYTQLPERFGVRQAPVPVRRPELLVWNSPLAAELGLHSASLPDSSPDERAAIFSGNTLPKGAAPLAMAYAGHQFGAFVPQLGDGRALLLGEVMDTHGNRRDLQLKGAGQTPFSRRGDGRAALGPVLREYLVSEAMHALGIPTTRALAVVATGETVLRETPLPGAVLTRVAASHIRIGTFQYFAARRDSAAVAALVDMVIRRHYPQAAETPNPPLALLQAIAARQADLVARWLNVGFIHGVMNTDNSAVSGETLDYGPCAFMDAYDPQTVFSAIDTKGRYAYANQPTIAHWNLMRLAECLIPLLDSDAHRAAGLAQEALATFVPAFEAGWLGGMRRKLGLLRADPADAGLIGDLLALMQTHQADFTLTFRQLCSAGAETQPPLDTPLDTLLDAPLGTPLNAGGTLPETQAVREWFSRWHHRRTQETTSPAARRTVMTQANPDFIPRNHQVEKALWAAVAANDLTPFTTLQTVLQRPYEDQPAYAAYTRPPLPHEQVAQTFCGT